MKISVLPILFFLSISNFTSAQGFVWGAKGGLAIGNQRFNEGGTFNNGLLFKYHGDLFIESAGENATSVIYAQAGYHIRGHARRFRSGQAFNYQTQQFEATSGYTEEFLFNNLALILGFKKRGVLGSDNAFYAIGLRGEYNLSNNLYDGSTASSGIFSLYVPTKEFVNKLNYGLSLSGGYEFPFTDLAGGFVEFSIHQDISRQYFQPMIPVNFTDPISGSRISSIPEQSIRNLSFEITVGIKFLRKVVYTD